jgi:hypothetical protein
LKILSSAANDGYCHTGVKISTAFVVTGIMSLAHQVLFCLELPIENGSVGF